MFFAIDWLQIRKKYYKSRPSVKEAAKKQVEVHIPISSTDNI